MSKWNTVTERDVRRTFVVDEYHPTATWREYLAARKQ